MESRNKISQFLNEHRIAKRYRLVALVMSLAVVFSVCGSLVMPAISATEEDLNDGIMLIDEEGTDTDSSDSTIDFTVDVAWEQTSTGTETSTGYLTIYFTFTSENAHNITSNTTIIYTLPDGITSTENNYSGVLYDGTTEAADYIIVDGVIYITYRDDYINNVIADSTSSMAAQLTFDATVTRGEDGGQTETYTFGDGENAPSITVNFNARSIDLAKSGTLSDDGSYITWELTVSNPECVDLNGYTISDDMLSDIIENSLSVTDSNYTYSSDDGSITFGSTTATSITITYQTAVDSSSSKTTTVTNEASLEPGDGESGETASAESEVEIPGAYTVEKSGTADYSDGTTTPNKEITWTITVTATNDGDFTGLTISDTTFSSDNISSIVTQLESMGFTVTYTSDSVYISASDGTTTGSFTLTYTTEAESTDGSSNTTNTVEIYSGSDDEPIDSDTAEVQYKPYSLGKSVSSISYDDTNQVATIRWYIELSSSTDLYDMTITDEMFSKAVAGSMEVYYNNDWQSSSDYTLNGDTFTITQQSVTKVKIYFETTVSYDEITDGNYTQVTNTADFGDWISTSATATVGVNTMSKSYDSDSVTTSSQTIENEDKTTSTVTTITIPWTVYYKRTLGFAGVTITDTISQNNYGKHYILSDSSAITVTDSSGNTVDSSYYTVTFYDSNGNEITDSTTTEAYSFAITFSDSFTGTTEIYISYSTTAVATDLPTDGTYVGFSNAVTGVDTSASSTYNYSYKADPYEKYAVDSEGNIITSSSIIDLETTTVYEYNGSGEVVSSEEYYVFGWVIYFDGSSVPAGSTITDTMDGSFIFGEYEYYKGWGYTSQTTTYNWNNVVLEHGERWGATGYDIWSTYNNDLTESDKINDDGELQIDFTLTSVGYSNFIYYTTLISVDDLAALMAENGGSYEIKNSIVYGDYDPVESSQTVTQGTLEKGSIYNSSANSNSISYQIYVNPNAEDLDSDSDTLTLTDTFSSDTDVSVTIGNFSVMYYDEDSGEMKELDASEYSYYLESSESSTTETVYNSGEITSSSGNTYNALYSTSVSNLKAGDIITLKCTSAISENAIYFDDYTSLTSSYSYEDGYYYYTFTLENDYDGNISFRTSTGSNETAEITVTRTTTTYSELTITVPDEMYLVIEYTFTVVPSSSETSATVTNSVSIESVGNTDSAVKSDQMELSKTTTGINSIGGNYIVLQKVDSKDFTETLSAEFKLYRTDDGENWYPATGFSDEDTTVEGYTVTWGLSAATEDSDDAYTFTTDEIYEIQLDNAYIYKLVEVTAPAGYEISGDGVYYFIFNQTSTSLSNLSSAIEALGDVTITQVASQQEYFITNARVGYTLPYTGSNGVTNYLLAGGAITLTALACIRIKKRRSA